MQARFGFARQDVDASREPSRSGVERPAVNDDAFDLREVDVKRRRIHPVGAGAVQGMAVDAQGEVVALLSAQDDIVGDAALAHLLEAGEKRQRLAGVAGEALADLREPSASCPADSRTSMRSTKRSRSRAMVTAPEALAGSSSATAGRPPPGGWAVKRQSTASGKGNSRRPSFVGGDGLDRSVGRAGEIDDGA